MTPDDLAPHPEGGRYREVYRSATELPDGGTGGPRAACTHIYFHLLEGESSRWHRVTADEVWNLYRGAVRLWLWDGAGEPESVDLTADDDRFCHVVPAGVWQAAEPQSEEALVGCTVAPGFCFDDFCLLHEGTPEGAALSDTAPDLARLLAPPVRPAESGSEGGDEGADEGAAAGGGN